MIGQMSQIGVEGLNRDAKQPVAELLKGGQWLLPVENSKISGAMKDGFSKIQHGIIGNLLASYQVWVELDEAPAKEGPPTCTALGTLLEDNVGVSRVCGNAYADRRSPEMLPSRPPGAW